MTKSIRIQLTHSAPDNTRGMRPLGILKFLGKNQGPVGLLEFWRIDSSMPGKPVFFHPFAGFVEFGNGVDEGRDPEITKD